jgi:hypothetical protein
LQSIRRPASLIPGISEELETFLLRAIGMELDADGRLETLKGDDSVLFLERGTVRTVRTVKGLKEGMSWYSTLYEGLIRYHDELEDLRSATRISVRPSPPQVVTTPAILLSIEEMSSLPPLPRLIKKLHLSPGDTFGGYLLQRYVANGAFCCVYEAINVEDGSISAIKIGKSTEEIEIDGLPTTLEGARWNITPRPK